MWYNLAQQKSKKLYILRGISGSGKSTLAKELSEGGMALSTDDYFMDNGQYKYDPNRISAAHQWNIKRARRLMEYGLSPIVT